MSDGTRRLRTGAPSHLLDVDESKPPRHRGWQFGYTAVAATVATVVTLLVLILPDSSTPGVDVGDQTITENTGKDDEGPDASPPPKQADAAGRMEVDPGRASPGDVVALTFPGEGGVESLQDANIRGAQFVLQGSGADGWEDVAYLFSDAGGADDPHYLLIEDVPENFSFTQQGVTGPGPDHVRLPEAITSGHYRICARSSNGSLCVSLEVR